MTGVRGLGHVNLRAPTEMIEALRRFYVEAIGLHEGPRPHFRSNSSGYWLYAGEHDVIHLSVDPRRSTIAEMRHAGFDHFALLCDRDELAAMRARLDALGFEYSIDEVEQRDQMQLFLTDPLGTVVELTFAR